MAELRPSDVTSCPARGAPSCVVIEQLQLKDAEAVRLLVYSRVFCEDVWRMACDNLTQPRALGIAVLCSGLVHCLTGSALWSAVLSLGVLPVTYALYIRYIHLELYLQGNCKDVCRGGAGLHEHWSNTSDDRKLVVAKIGDKVAGTAAVSRLSETSAEMQRVAVLMTHLVDYCKEKGFHDVIIQVTSANTRALSIYKKYGFQDHMVVSYGGILRWTAVRLRLPLLGK